ncbi:hypothetical protein [Maridesulfovibrio frigidus]|uniref:hypothetical protein n=1 Tax=Maridesulfovibrio frigidus TaxID=340956 RepID=UPI0012ECB61A|nr:hypothetical protein [Maridesulfovibrio frigidus]
MMVACVVGLFFVPCSALAEPKAYVGQNLSFGLAISLSDVIIVRVDATGAAPQNAEAEGVDKTCYASGGHPSELLFYDYDGLSIQLDFPTTVPLYDPFGTPIGLVRNLKKFTSSEPVPEDDHLVSYIGGELVINSSVESLSGAISVLITTY